MTMIQVRSQRNPLREVLKVENGADLETVEEFRTVGASGFPLTYMLSDDPELDRLELMNE